MPGDTIQLNCEVPSWEGTTRLGTVNIVMEDLEHKNMWRLRYPILEGYFDASLVIPASMPNGHYMISAELQPVFFQLTGRMLNKQKDDSIRYSMQLEDKTIIAGSLALNEAGEFRMPRHVFSGRATLFFSPHKLGKNKSQANVVIKTPLDSPFTSLGGAHLTISIGNTQETPTANLYTLDSALITNRPMGTLENVTVKGQAKTPVQQLDEQKSSGYFKNERAQIFSGLNGEFSGFVTILDYLPGRVAGLNVFKNTEEFGQYLVTWRNEPTAFFLDEIPVDLETVYNFPPSEIAFIKVFPPPFMGVPLGSGGGAIAIYSITATLGKEPRFRNRFVIHGFSPALYTLKTQ